MSQHDLCAWWSQQILQVLPNQSFTNWSYGNLKSLQVCMHAHFLSCSVSLLSPSLFLPPRFVSSPPPTSSPSPSLCDIVSLSLSPGYCLSLTLYLPHSFSIPHMLSPLPSLSLPLPHSVSVSLSLQSVPCTRETTVQTHTPLDASRPHLQTEKEERHHGISTCPCQSVVTNNTCSVRMPIGHNKQHIIFNVDTVQFTSRK